MLGSPGPMDLCPLVEAADPDAHSALLQMASERSDLGASAPTCLQAWSVHIPSQQEAWVMKKAHTPSVVSRRSSLEKSVMVAHTFVASSVVLVHVVVTSQRFR